MPFSSPSFFVFIEQKIFVLDYILSETKKLVKRKEKIK